jgi:hypothetical protein
MMNTDQSYSRNYRIALAVVALAFLSTLTITAQESASSFLEFKQELMPQVGKTISVQGVLQSAKLGWLVAFNDFGIYLYSSDAKHPGEMNALNRFSGMSVRVTGTLRYFPQPPTPSGDVAYAVPPEHFFFDVAAAKVTWHVGTAVNQRSSSQAVRPFLWHPMNVSRHFDNSSHTCNKKSRASLLMGKRRTVG